MNLKSKKTFPFLLSAAVLLVFNGAAQAQDISKSMTVTGNHVGAFNVNAHVQGPKQTVAMQKANNPPKAMYNKMGGMDNCPDAGTPTPPATSSPTSFTAPAGYAPPVVPPWGSQTSPDGTNISVYPGGTTITTPPGGAPPTITPPGLGENKTHGSVIARQVRPNGSIVQIYEDGFYSVTRSGTTTFSSKSIW